jgi:hypothetical protein
MDAQNTDVMQPHLRRMSLLKRAILPLLACIATACPAASVTSTEYELKAVFLFNFAQFVEWPASAFSGPEDPITLCVLGPDPFGAELDAILQGERIEGRPLIAQRFETATQIRNCHLLFVNQSSAADLRKTLDALKSRPILTVGESEAFTSAGGMIRFFTEGNKVRLLVNPRAADEANLRLSSKLLRSSQLVARAE